MVLETAEAIVIALRGNSNLVNALPAGVAGIGQGLLPSGTRTPNVLVFDAADQPSYTLGNSEAYSTEILDIYVYAEDDDDESAQTVAMRILRLIEAALSEVTVLVNERRVLSIRRGGFRPSKWETVSSEERYYRAGYQWEVMTGPA